MDSKELEQITNSIQTKLGKDNSALISDDLGILITKNNESLKVLAQKEADIKQLKDTNEKLVVANGNLLQSVPMADNYNHRENEVEESKTPFNFRDAFDENGRFKK